MLHNALRKKADQFGPSWSPDHSRSKSSEQIMKQCTALTHNKRRADKRYLMLNCQPLSCHKGRKISYQQWGSELISKKNKTEQKKTHPGSKSKWKTSSIDVHVHHPREEKNAGPMKTNPKTSNRKVRVVRYMRKLKCIIHKWVKCFCNFSSKRRKLSVLALRKHCRNIYLCTQTHRSTGTTDPSHIPIWKGRNIV